MARYETLIKVSSKSRLLIITMLIFCFSLPLVPAQAWVSKRSPNRVHYRIPFTPKWVSRLKKGAFYKYKRRELSSPIASDNLIFVGVDSGYFYAFDQKNGGKKWRFKADAPINSMAVAGFGKVFFGDDDANLYALQVETGELIWKKRYNSPVTAAPIIVNDKLYFVNTAGSVFAVNPDTGNRIWTYPYKASDREMTMLGNGGLAYTIVKKRGQLYVGFRDGHLIALDANKGSLIWNKDLSLGDYKFVDLDMKPLIEGDRIYVATFSGHLFCLKLGDGSTIWQAAIGSGVRFAISDDLLFVAGADGVIYKLNKNDGTLVWKYDAGKGALTKPIVYKDLLIVGSTKNSILFIDIANGQKFMQRFARKNIYSDPILTGKDGNLLVYLSNAGRLYALKLKEEFR